MDLNCLFHRRGISLMMADRAACERSRDAHLGMAGRYAARIQALHPRRAFAA